MPSSSAVPDSMEPEVLVTGEDLARVDDILRQYQHDRSETIAILLAVQDTLGYLPIPVLKHVAEQLEVSPVALYGTVTFYTSFRLNPPGRHKCTVCTGTACHVRGAVNVLKEFERRLEIPAGSTTPDRHFQLETVNCVGACAMGPLVIVDDEYHGNITPTKIPRLLRRLERDKAEEVK